MVKTIIPILSDTVAVPRATRIVDEPTPAIPLTSISLDAPALVMELIALQKTEITNTPNM